MAGERYWIEQWAKDETEVDGLLEVFGASCEGKPAKKKARLLELFDDYSGAQAASFFYRWARQFALMLDDILTFCDRHDVSIRGEISLPSGAPLGRGSALDTRWAQVAGSGLEQNARGQILSIFSELEDVIARLDIDDLLVDQVRRSETPIGAYHRQSPDAVKVAIRTAMNKVKGLFFTERRYQSVSKMDRDGLDALHAQIDELGSVFPSLASVDGVPAIVEQISSYVAILREAVANADTTAPDNRSARSLQLSSALIAIEETRARVARLAEQAEEVRRRADGFHEFTRSEFWPQRWRLFELWVFIRALGVLERAGGVIEFLCVNAAVWELRYSDFSEPVARCRFNDRQLAIYYQLKVAGETRSNMPDIAIKDEASEAFIAIIDPKHGPTRNLPDVSEVLHRYVGAFHAPFSAVVSYTRIPGYDFLDVTPVEEPPDSHHLLISDVGPGSKNLRRFELRLEEYFIATLGIAASTAVDDASGREKARAGAAILFHTTSEGEWDEPSGWWLAMDGQNARPAQLIETIVLPDGLGLSDLNRILPSPDGKRAILMFADRCLLLREEGEVTPIAPIEASASPDFAWQADSALILESKSGVIFDRNGVVKDRFSGAVPAAMGWWIGDIACRLTPAEDPDCLAFDCRRGKAQLRKPLAIPVPDSATWLNEAECRPVGNLWCIGPRRPDPYRRSAWRSSRSGLFIGIGPDLLPAAQPDGWNGAALGRSASGQGFVVAGPRSRSDIPGRILFKILQPGDDQNDAPLTRCTLSDPDSQRNFHRAEEGLHEISFSPDETRIAFLAGLEDFQVAMARRGDRFSTRISLAGQSCRFPVWVSARMARLFEERLAAR